MTGMQPRQHALCATLTFAAMALCAGPCLAESQAVRQCKSYVQGRIDVLDAELHKGDKPNVARKLVKRRDRLRGQIAECERNPMAYKKDI